MGSRYNDSSYQLQFQNCREILNCVNRDRCANRRNFFSRACVDLPAEIADCVTRLPVQTVRWFDFDARAQPAFVQWLGPYDLFVCGRSNGDLIVYDSRACVPVQTRRAKQSGARPLCATYHAALGTLFVGDSSGALNAFNINLQQLEDSWEFPGRAAMRSVQLAANRSELFVQKALNLLVCDPAHSARGCNEVLSNVLDFAAHPALDLLLTHTTDAAVALRDVRTRCAAVQSMQVFDALSFAWNPAQHCSFAVLHKDSHVSIWDCRNALNAGPVSMFRVDPFAQMLRTQPALNALSRALPAAECSSLAEIFKAQEFAVCPQCCSQVLASVAMPKPVSLQATCFAYHPSCAAALLVGDSLGGVSLYQNCEFMHRMHTRVDKDSARMVSRAQLSVSSFDVSPHHGSLALALENESRSKGGLAVFAPRAASSPSADAYGCGHFCHLAQQIRE